MSKLALLLYAEHWKSCLISSFWYLICGICTLSSSLSLIRTSCSILHGGTQASWDVSASMLLHCVAVRPAAAMRSHRVVFSTVIFSQARWVTNAGTKHSLRGPLMSQVSALHSHGTLLLQLFSCNFLRLISRVALLKQKFVIQYYHCLEISSQTCPLSRKYLCMVMWKQILWFPSNSSSWTMRYLHQGAMQGAESQYNSSTGLFQKEKCCQLGDTEVLKLWHFPKLGPKNDILWHSHDGVTCL